ncbi:MAG: DUF2207 domain-containing protein [Atopobiaceae bacterium]|nr:DUF2207 domain-containing protein [Atopobiaceae bacterium]
MNVAAANLFMETIKSARDVVSQLPSWVPILVYAVWFVGIVCVVVAMHIKVRRFAKTIKNAKNDGQPPLALTDDVHPAVLAMIGGGENCLVVAFTATVLRLATKGVFVSNKESERLHHASLDVRKVPEGLDPIDEAAIRIVKELSRADIKDRRLYLHYSRVFYEEYCESFKNFQDCVLNAYRMSPLLVKNSVHLHAGVFMLYLFIPVVVALALISEVSIVLGALICAMLGLMAVSVEVAELQKCGEFNAEGTCLLKQLEDEKRWCVLFATGKPDARLDTKDLMRVSVYAAACDRLTQFASGLARSRNTSSLSAVPGIQLLVPREDDRQGRYSLEMYLESVLFGLRSAEKYAEGEDPGKILGGFTKEATKELLPYLIIHMLLG